MNEKKGSWLDWLLYFGSKDERNRRGADRAGHLAFWVAFAIATLDFALRWPGVVQGGFRDIGSMVATLSIILGSATVYTVHWVSRGLTFSDTPAQKKLLKTLVPVTGILCGVLVSFAEFCLVGWWSVAIGLVAGVGASFLVGWLYQVIDSRARARAEAGLVHSGEDE